MATFSGAFKKWQDAGLRIRGFVFSSWVRGWGGTVGHGLKVSRNVRMLHHPTARWRIGDDVFIGVGAIIDVWPGSELAVGDRAMIMHYVHIGVTQSISIGSDTGIGESSSVRDQDHDLSDTISVIRSTVRSVPVIVGDDVWVGRGVAILRGTTIGDHAVIAANAVVRGQVPEYAIMGGVPAKILKYRKVTEEAN